ncbi:MAG: hypothetical protein APF81_22905 [Desulfosporosinus sp. BRH_c37]|nr:MAG: hypothetical protein APF81_22905 [Desulfosporosinus sp. BRH_c37]
MDGLAFLFFLGLFTRSKQEIKEKSGRLKGELSEGLKNRLCVEKCEVVSSYLLIRSALMSITQLD